MEIKKLREEVVRLQKQCHLMQTQMERLLEKNKKGIFSWMKLGFWGNKVEEREIIEGGEIGFGRQTPIDTKMKEVRGRSTPIKWRKSMS